VIRSALGYVGLGIAAAIEIAKLARLALRERP